MRTISWLIPLPLLMWLIDWAADTKGEPLLALAFGAFLVAVIVTLIWCVAADIEEVREGGLFGGREE